MRLVRVAVPVPALDSLTYSLPDEHPLPVVGARVLVPLGSRVLTGCVVDRGDAEEPPASTIKPVIEVLDTEPYLPEDVVRLATWVADYYACGIGSALAAAMPPMAGGGPSGGRGKGFRTIRVAALTAQGLDIATHADDEAAKQIAGHKEGGAAALRIGPRQREALTLLAGAPEGLETAQLAARGIGSPALSRLATLGLLTFTRRQIDRDPFQAPVATATSEPPPLVLTAEQDAALTRLRSLADRSDFQAALLHGVTGSGKTELYLRLATEVRRRGRGVLLLVPEIALTPAVALKFRHAFGDQVAIQHSGLSDGERHDQWHRIRRGDVDVVVGTRSAVFAPLRAIGLVIVDEEHDGSYKQEETPRYNGRDVAVMRAREAGALVVLGSATPSMESYQNAKKGRYTLVTLFRRVLDRPLADVRIVDMREEYAAAGPDVVLSATLCEAMGETLSRGEQAIVLLNRRGFASSVFCRQCGSTLECPNCSLSLTVHRAAHRARCHYCNHAIPLPKVCASCSGKYIELVGFGTERVEAEVRERFPDARVARVDRDTIRRRGAIAALLARFAARELDVLVGTQMIAKGHDFPRVTLVGVISADVGLGLADFRAGERTFQLLTQVAGRAGRGEIRGQAIVQTLFPKHYSIQHACRQDYAGFFEQELNFRQAMQYPPAVALVNAVVKGRTQQGAQHDAGELVQALRVNGAPYRVLGPAPAPLSRLKGEYRAQFFMKGTHRTAMRQALIAALATRPDIKRRTIVDVDPMSVL
jgi:primosomal protein N' (replication factor Y) (superfamily II helicase)